MAPPLPVPISKPAGAFPRNELGPDEKVIFEGRPSFFGSCLPGLLWLAICGTGGLLAWALAPLGSPCSLTYLVLAVMAAAGPFIYFCARRSGTSFALTDRRVLLREGRADLRARTHSLQLSQVLGTVGARSFSGRLAGAGYMVFSAAAGTPGLVWPSVPGHAAVRQFIDGELQRLRTSRPAPDPAAPNQAGLFPAPPVQPAVLPPPPGLVPLQIPDRRCSRCGLNFGGKTDTCPYCGAKA